MIRSRLTTNIFIIYLVLWWSLFKRDVSFECSEGMSGPVGEIIVQFAQLYTFSEQLWWRPTGPRSPRVYPRWNNMLPCRPAPVCSARDTIIGLANLSVFVNDHINPFPDLNHDFSAMAVYRSKLIRFRIRLYVHRSYGISWNPGGHRISGVLCEQILFFKPVIIIILSRDEQR